MRTTWNGSISFGLVSIPVGLAPATKPAARASDVSFRHAAPRVRDADQAEALLPGARARPRPGRDRQGLGGREGPVRARRGRGARGAQSAATTRARSRSAASSTLDEVDPIFFDRTYFLVPGQAPAARRPYVLLLNAMRETGMAAMGRFVQQGREKLCLIRPKGEALALETLFLSEDVYSQAEIEEAVDDTTVKEPELELARQVIASLAGDFDPSDLQSDYRRDLRALLEAKLAGEEITTPEPEAESARDRPDGGARAQRRGGEAGQAGREGADEDAARPRKKPQRAPEAGQRALRPRSGRLGICAMDPPRGFRSARLRQCVCGSARAPPAAPANSVLSILPW